MATLNVWHVHRRTLGSQGPFSSLQEDGPLLVPAYICAAQYSWSCWVTAECASDLLGGRLPTNNITGNKLKRDLDASMMLDIQAGRLLTCSVMQKATGP